MAPKRANARDGTPSTPATTQAGVATAGTTPAPVPKAQKTTANQNYSSVVTNIVDHYLDTTPQRTKLVDAFMAFLVVAGALQFAYCVLAGNYVSPRTAPAEPGSPDQPLTRSTALQCLPLRLLLHGRAVCVDWYEAPLIPPSPPFSDRAITDLSGLTPPPQLASLRIQTTEANKSDFPAVSPERYARLPRA